MDAFNVLPMTHRAHPRVLIVEDEKLMSDPIVSVLKSDGIACRVVQTGADALNALAAEPFDLVLLDIVLPRMDGWQVLSALQERKTHPMVVVLSNLGQAEERRRALDLGAADYLVKADTSILDLARRVRGWVGT